MGSGSENLAGVHVVQGNKVPQYIAALSVCLGAVAAGTVLGWTSNIDIGDLDLNLSEEDKLSVGEWTGSLVNLGAMIMCIPIGYYCDFIGRKYAALSMTILFTIGWLLIMLYQNIAMIYVGRFILGMAGGSFCIAAPMYTSETAETSVRGALGSYFQLLLTVGILISNAVGFYAPLLTFNIVCLVIPLVFAVVFFFQPETPVYSLKKGKEEEARKALRRLRGPSYNVELELKELKAQIDSERQMNISFMESLRKRATKKALVICFGLMTFQQLSGINAVIFYTKDIFDRAGTKLDFSPVIIVGIMQVVATFVSSLVIDKFGRKILLIASDLFMSLAALALGIFFTLQNRTEQDTSGIGFLPVLSLCVFIIVFSLGFGPIPWMISSELFPPEIKSTASSAAGTYNWFLSFIVTKFYQSLSEAVGNDSTFYAFAVISCLGTLFVILVVPETKGKSLDQIQDELNGVQKSSKPKYGVENAGFTSQL